MKLMDVSLIVPYEKNAKLHPPEQIEALAKIITAFGFRQPILIDSDNVIVSGHGRLLAAKKLGLKKVPVMIADDLSPKQIRAYRIADNKIAETDWDTETLIAELEQAVADDMLEYTAHTEDELQRLIDGPEKKTVSFETKELNEGDFQEFDHQCPKCGFNFDGPEK